MKRMFRAIVVLFAYCIAFAAQGATQQWDCYEISLKGPADGDPFVDVTVSATFACGDKSIQTTGFYDGQGTYRIRFMPPSVGTWKYLTTSSAPELSGKTGEFVCEKPGDKNHGMVRVANTYHFAYDDGTPYKPIGTTCYAWVFQPDALQDQTIETLKASPFNKVRMCVLPTEKMDAESSAVVPFVLEADRTCDTSRFDPRFFQNLERRLAQLRDLNIQADLILFHPYNSSGLNLDRMSAEADDRYVRYVVARLSAYRNVWWSLANEFDLLRQKRQEDWDRLGPLVQHEDPYGHPRSIHFSRHMYDPSKPWLTHMSVQNGAAVEDFGRARLYRDVIPKPVVYDEVCYEGDIDRRWGQLKGEEMALRFWHGTIDGTYVGHGETLHDAQQRAWVSKGGKWIGTSVPRIAFLKQILDDAPKEGIEPIDRFFHTGIGGKAGEWYLIYFGTQKPAQWTFELPRDGVKEGMNFEVDVLDTWNMTINHLDKKFTTVKSGMYLFRAPNNEQIDLPGKPYIALRVRRLPGQDTGQMPVLQSD